MTHRDIVVLVGLSWMVGACGSSDSGGAAGAGGASVKPVCAPGQQVACACPGGVQGAQICKADGSGWEACQGCAGGGNGGGGSGGADASAGTSGAAGLDAAIDVGGGGGTAGAGGTLEDANAGGAGAAGAAGVCAQCDPTLEQCYNGLYCVAKLVAVTGGYSIDATEVTQDQYAAWLGTNPDPSVGQLAYCSFNTDFQPSPSCGGDAGACVGAGCGKHPQVCVDWCDAYAYCKGVGKRLCGKIGGGAIGYHSYKNAALSQWYNACSSGGVHNYPYGGDAAAPEAVGYDSEKCNGAKPGATAPVGSFSECVCSEQGYGGVYDLSGNVAEWEDSCWDTTGANDLCRVRGGSYWTGAINHLNCSGEGVGNRGSGTMRFGIRCCSSP